MEKLSSEYVEIYGRSCALYYETVRRVIEVSRIIRVNYRRSIYVQPVNELDELDFDLMNREVFIKFRGKIFRITDPPTIEWLMDLFIDKVDKSDKEISLLEHKTHEDRASFAAQEAYAV